MLTARKTREGTGYLTSLTIVGGSLLMYASEKLRIPEMSNWKNVEYGDPNLLKRVL